MEARLLATTQQAPPDGSTHWSTRKLAKVLGISHVLVSRVWRRAGLQPHRFERYMLSNDPNFEEKAADGLDTIVSAWVGGRYLARKAKPYGDAAAAIWVPAPE